MDLTTHTICPNCKAEDQNVIHQEDLYIPGTTTFLFTCEFCDQPYIVQATTTFALKVGEITFRS